MARRQSRKAARRQSRKSSRRQSRKAARRQSRKSSRRQQGGAQCAAVPLQNMPFAQQRGGMAPYEAGGNDLLMDKAAMVQAQSFDQIGMIQEAGRIAAAAQHGGRRSRRQQQKQSRKQKQRQSRKQKQRQSRKQKQKQQRGGMSPFDADPMLLPKAAYAFTGVNPQFHTEASVQPALKMGAGPQA